MARRRSAKPLSLGSNPSAASNGTEKIWKLKQLQLVYCLEDRLGRDLKIAAFFNNLISI